jgi:RNA polymerase sigma-54 factor
LLTRLGRLLRPYPRLGDGEPGPVPRPPDLVFEAHGGTVRAVLTEPEVLDLDVDPGYLAAAGRLAAARGGVRDARTMIGRIQHRWSMLQRLGDLLGEHHAQPLLAGSTAFPPLTQAQAAGRLRVHESTISRAVAHRHARLVSGQLITLRRMFGAHHDARAAVAELCSATPRPPDRRVVELLAARGIVLSRRAVTKYRLALGLSAR